MFEYRMPKMDHLSEEATIMSWLKREGDCVQKGDVLMEVETGKTVLPVESPFSGRIVKIEAPEGETVPVQAVIALVEEL